MLQVTDKGITVDSFNTIYARLVEKFKLIYGNDVNLDSDTPDGQLLALFSQEIETIHQNVAFIVQMLDPYQATGQWLDQRALYAGIIRNMASYSYIDEAIITGIPKTNIPINSVIIDSNKNKWIITEQAALNDLGSARVKLRSDELGDFTVNSGEAFSLATIIIGVEKVIANSDSYGGADEESDARLLRRFMLSHSINNYDDKSGIKAALYNITGVTKCEVYENYTGDIDEKGVPAHTLNAVILGGDDSAIADVIGKKKIGGCGLFGNIKTSTNLRGADRIIYFDRPAKTEVAVSMVLGRYKSFEDIDTKAIKDNLMSLGFEIGENIYATRLISSINLTNGFYIKSLTVNKSNIAEIGYREYGEITSVEVLIDE